MEIFQEEQLLEPTIANEPHLAVDNFLWDPSLRPPSSSADWRTQRTNKLPYCEIVLNASVSKEKATYMARARPNVWFCSMLAVEACSDGTSFWHPLQFLLRLCW